jgi:hypothetical protein
LAKKLIKSPVASTNPICYFCTEQICPDCTSVNDAPKICPECSSAFHNCCLINYILENNIGIPHIFRCPKCDVLLKINQDEIVRPKDASIHSAEEYLGLEEVKETEAEIQFKPIPQIKELGINSETEKAIKQSSLSKETMNSEGKPRTVRIGGYFGKLYTVQKNGDKLVYQKVKTHQDTLGDNESKFNQAVNKETSTAPIDTEKKFNSCPECGTPFTSDFRKGDICPFCGHKLD